MNRIVVAIVFGLLYGCAHREPEPRIVQVVPEKEPVCGFTRPWLHCCAAQNGPNLVVRCVELKKEDEPKTFPPPTGRKT